MKFSDLKKRLQESPPFPAYFVTGDDAYLMQAAVGHFKKLVTEMPEMNVSTFNETADARAVLDACETLPVLSQLKLVLCYDFKGDGAAFLPYIANPNSQTVLVFISEKLTESFAKIVQKLEIVDCGKLADDPIKRWIGAKLGETDTKITVEAAELLLASCSRDMSRIARETEKLGIYRAGGTVVKDDVDALVAADTEYKTYELSDAVAKRDAPKAAEILRTLLASGVQEITLLGMLYGHFRRMLYCAINPKDPDLAKKLGVKEFAVVNARAQARSFPVVRLKKICDGFHQADFAVKSGEIADRLALETCILTIFLQS